MAVIIQADPYDALIRKIGYSVGLEKIIERVDYLVDLYVEDCALSKVKFDELVEKRFDRGIESAEHFANFYGCLNLLKNNGNQYVPLYNLDSLSILKRYFVNDRDAFLAALKFILLQALIESDGEIFLNGLGVDFKPEQFRTALISMINYKREAIRNVIESTPLLKTIDSKITIETQKTQTSKEDKTSHKKNELRFARRTENLSTILKRTEPLSDLTNLQKIEINISDDYLKKVSATRKGWASECGLFVNGQKTAVGVQLLNSLEKKLGIKTSLGCYVFWPYASELALIRIVDPNKIHALKLTKWDLLCAIAEGLGNVEVDSFNEANNYSEIINLLLEIYELYKKGDKIVGSIRHQLPLYVAEPCIVAISYAKSIKIPPFKEIVDSEGQKKQYRRINKTPIRGTEGAIVFAK